MNEEPIDSSGMIHLAKAGGFPIATKVVGRLVAVPAVWREAVDDGLTGGHLDARAAVAAEASGLIRRVVLTAEERVAAKLIGSDYELGSGESETLAYALTHTRRALVDDRRARRIAVSLGVVAIPTVELPVLGRHRDVLEVVEAQRFLRKIAVKAATMAEHERRLL